MGIGILDVGQEIAEAHGITNESCQGLEPQDDPLALDRSFPSGFTISKGRKMQKTYPPTCQAKEKARKMQLGVSRRDDLRLDNMTDSWRCVGCRVPVL